MTALQALDWLARDEATGRHSPYLQAPAADVAARLLRAAQGCGKPVVCNFIGYPPPGRRLGNLTFASGLSDAAALAVGLRQKGPPKLAKAGRPLSGYVRGLFSGGTLAYEMLRGLEPVLTPLYSNLTGDTDQRLTDLTTSRAHTILYDLGDDAFTEGRLHPMMDNELRLRRLGPRSGRRRGQSARPGRRIGGGGTPRSGVRTRPPPSTRQSGRASAS